MQKKLPTLTVRELINFLKDFPSNTPVMFYCENDIVPQGFIKDVYEQAYISKTKYESEDDFYNVVCLHVEKDEVEGDIIKNEEKDKYQDLYDDLGLDLYDDDDEGEEWKKQ